MCRRVIIILSLLGLATLSSPGLEREELVPEGGFTIRVSNTVAFWEKLNQLYLAQLLEDDRFVDFTIAMDKKIKAKAAKGKLLFSNQLIRAQLPVFNREIVFSRHEKLGEKTNLVYVVAAATAAEYNQMLQRDQWFREQTKAPVSTVKTEFQGVEIQRHVVDCGDKTDSLWNAHLNETAFTSNDKEWLEQTIVRLKKEQVSEPSGSAPSARIYLPISQLIHGLILDSPAENHAATLAFYRALGLLGVGDIRMDIGISEQFLSVACLVPIVDFDKGLFTLLDTTPIDPNLPRLFAPSASVFYAGRIDLKRFWQELPGILRAAPPEVSGRVVPMIHLFQQQTGVDIGNDLLANLNNELHLFSVPTSPTNHSSQIALGLSDASAMATSLDRLLAAQLITQSGMLEPTEYRGRTIHALKAQDLGANPTALCVVQDQLLIGGIDQIRETISRLDLSAPIQRNYILSEAADYLLQNPTPALFAYGGTNHKKAESLLHLKLSDSSFSMGIGLNSKDKDEQEELGDNEISFNYVSSFLNNSLSLTRKLRNGILHIIIFDHTETQGAP
jgi:hypothetical protein